jgi:hypothetical protein
VHGIERHLLFVSLGPKMDHPSSVEPPPWNVQQCYAHVDDNEEGDGAPSTETDTRSRMADKHPVAPRTLEEEAWELRNHGSARESDQQASLDDTKLVG